MTAKLRQPRLADLVAGSLRERILNGTFPAGSLLPKQDELFDEFGVSMPSIREALRILETEGLIRVQRGKIGGAVVQVPDADDAAYGLALVLESRAVPLDDVAEALRNFEPRCAAACAARSDRRRSVVPALRENLRAGEGALDDAERFVALARAFHELLVDRCGNETMRLVVGSLEALWSAQSTAAGGLGAFADREARRGSLAEHAALVERIAAGDVAGAEAEARAHLARPERSAVVGKGHTVRAGALRS